MLSKCESTGLDDRFGNKPSSVALNQNDAIACVENV